MRNLLAVALVATALTWAPEAWAKKEKAAASDEVKLEIKDTGIKTVDETFAKAKAPVESVMKARSEIDNLQKNLITALGLTEGTPFADALADLKTKAAGKITAGIDAKGMPELKPGDAVPANVQTAIDAVNNGFAAAGAAVAALSELPAQFQAIAADAQKYGDPAVLKDLAADNPAAMLKAPKTIAGNVSTLSKAPEEIKALAHSLDALRHAVSTSFQ